MKVNSEVLIVLERLADNLDRRVKACGEEGEAEHPTALACAALAQDIRAALYDTEPEYDEEELEADHPLAGTRRVG